MSLGVRSAEVGDISVHEHLGEMMEKMPALDGSHSCGGCQTQSLAGSDDERSRRHLLCSVNCCLEILGTIIF